MRAIVYTTGTGEITVSDLPAPCVRPNHVLVRNAFSLISAGTERTTVTTGRQSLVAKARSRPDQTKRVLESLRDVGPLETYRRVSERLATPMLLGYSCAGTVLAAGAGVDDLPVGTPVAAGGQGYACHAEIVLVPRNLCVAVPEDVPLRSASFSTVGAIALQGIHQADVPPGSRVAVIGLGLVGQLTLRELDHYGYDALGIDTDDRMVRLATLGGGSAFGRYDRDLDAKIKGRWGGAGADAVIVTAAAPTSDPVDLAGEIARDRAVVVIVGAVNVAPRRSTYYGKELSIRYSRSYGPGRYDRAYEEEGRSYPEGFVPWPERRNLSEFVRLVQRGLDLETLQPAIVPVEAAASAYDLLTAEGDERRSVILVSYGDASENPDPKAPVVLRKQPRSRRSGAIRLASVGAGSFATHSLFPHLRDERGVAFSWITTGGGLTAVHQGRRWGFESAVPDIEAGLDLGRTDGVLVVTRHDTHAEYATRVLERGLAVFCEKPLAITEQGLEAVATAWQRTRAPAIVGFNRRFAPAVRDLRPLLVEHPPLQLSYRVFAGKLPVDHWYFDLGQGGRLLGEVCHFIDTATTLIGERPIAVAASTPDAGRDHRRIQNVSLVVEYAGGATATIMYAGDTPPGAPKELIEVAADGVAARVDDFRSLAVWDPELRTVSYRGAAKGHAEEMKAFVEAVRGEDSDGTDRSFVQSLWTTLTALRAAEALASGGRVPVIPHSDRLRSVLGVPDLD